MVNFFEIAKLTANNDINFNSSVTENGAIGFATTGKNLLDINFVVPSLRKASDEDIIAKFSKAFYEDPYNSLLWLFFVRDVRGGLGERRLFKVCFTWFCNMIIENKTLNLEALKDLIKLIPEYGRYDDLYILFENVQLRELTGNIFKDQLIQDLENMKNNKSVSLLAKWLKSEKASSFNSRRLAKLTMQAVGMNAKEYRKTLSSLRKYIDVTEVKMSSNEWDKINYSIVPSKANLIYKNAFMRHDEDRYSTFIDQVNKGETKINSSTLYPHEIVSKYVFEESCWYKPSVKTLDATLEGLWKNLPTTFDSSKSTLVVADGSGSMSSKVGNSNTSALSVANALAIYFGERANNVYKNKYITFSENPKFVDFSSCKTLKDKLNLAYCNNEVANTNIEKVFDLILKTAIVNNLKQEDLPSNILIISDMEFDSAVTWDYTRRSKALMQLINDKFREKGYVLPRLVFWNVNSRSNTIPLNQNEAGVALISGFSTHLAKMVMSNELDPYKCLLETLNSDRYIKVAEVIKKFN